MAQFGFLLFLLWCGIFGHFTESKSLLTGKNKTTSDLICNHQEEDMLRVLLNQETMMRVEIEKKLQTFIKETAKADLLSKIQQLERSLQDIISTNMDQKSTITDLKAKTLAQEDKINEITNKYQLQKVALVKLKDELFNKIQTYKPKTAGAMFVRWGRYDCPTNDTELVYKGSAGGSHFNAKGGAAEFVCLPRDPDLTRKFGSSDHARIYGAEYDTSDFGHSNGDNVPCVVCRSYSASSTLMIPAKNRCYSGWMKQYSGYLSAGSMNHPSPTEYVCVDEKPEAVMGGRKNDNGKLLYPVRSKCGALPCPPYAEGTFLTCVVCTK